MTEADGQSGDLGIRADVRLRRGALADGVPGKVATVHLRHTHATILLKAGVPVKVVSERLGHSSPAFTMTVSQHVLPGMQADAARLFGEAVYGPHEDGRA